MELNSIGYINESELVNVREIDIEVLLIGSRVVGVTHDCLHDFESSMSVDDSVADTIAIGAEFVFDYATSKFLAFAPEWEDFEDKHAAIVAVKRLIANHNPNG